MGFGFNLFFIFILLPLSLVLFIVAIFNSKALKVLGYTWLTVVILVVVSFALRPLTTKKVLSKEDYYGSYIIDRKFCHGKQADWQYDHYRFEIKENDSIYFYVTDHEQIIKTYQGSIKTVSPHGSARLVVHMKDSTFHVTNSYPTTYRRIWNFYLVFNSPLFHNMFFKKGDWEPIED